MKALSLWDPWATLIALGAKQFETRSWSTRYRGPIAIHAAKKFGAGQKILCDTSSFKECLVLGGYLSPADLPLGQFVAVAELVEVYRTEEIVDQLSEQERAFGDYEPGRFAWKLEQICPIAPYPYPGKRFLWQLDGEMANLLRSRIKGL